MKESELYDLIGDDNLRLLVRDFYKEVEKDEIMRPMYPEILAPAEERMYLFLMQRLGGPTHYSDNRGHPALRARHANFHINNQARNNWMMNMMTALEKNPMDERAKVWLRKYFSDAATFLINKKD